jgi:hypothetical protein
MQLLDVDGIVGSLVLELARISTKSLRRPMSFDLFAALDPAAFARRWRATWRRWR